MRRDAGSRAGEQCVFGGQLQAARRGPRSSACVVVAIDQLGFSSTVSTVATVHSTLTTDHAPLVAISNLGATAQTARTVPLNSVNAISISDK